MSDQHHHVDLPAWRSSSRAMPAAACSPGVASVLPFGAFVEVAESIHGLLPVTEWAAAPEAGATVSVRILAIDVERRRLSLTQV